MKFALVNGQRQEAQPKLSGECHGCRSLMFAKCGKNRLWHWAHKSGHRCDPWWENETPWHRAWKDHFPVDWQEVGQRAEDGELHIADVRTPDGWVFEFQHSNLSPEERESREAFYQTLTWVVDGMRRTTDLARFLGAWASGEARDPNSNKRRISSPISALLRDWAGSRAHVFFDFGHALPLWWLYPESDNRRAYVQYISRAEFIRIHREKGLSEFDSRVQNFIAFIAPYESPPPAPRPERLTGVHQEQNRHRIIRRRFRL